MFSFKLVLFFSPCSYDQSCFLKSVSFCTAVCLIFQCYCCKPYFITFLISGSVSPYHPISKKIFFALDYLLACGKIFFLSMPHTHLMPYTFQVFHSTSMKLGMKYFNWCNNIGQKITVTSSARSLLHMLKWPRKNIMRYWVINWQIQQKLLLRVASCLLARILIFHSMSISDK